MHVASYSKLSLGADLQLDSLDAIYAQYGACDSPSELPPDVLQTMQQLFDMQQNERRQDGRRLLMALMTGLVLLLAIGLGTGHGMRYEKHMLQKRDDACSSPPIGPIVTQQTQSATVLQPPPGNQCSPPVIISAGGACQLNTDAFYISCGSAAIGGPISYCGPGTTLGSDGEPTPFAASCATGRCGYNCGQGYSAVSTSLCTPYVPPAPTPVPAPVPAPAPSPAPTPSSPTADPASSTTLGPGSCSDDAACSVSDGPALLTGICGSDQSCTTTCVSSASSTAVMSYTCFTTNGTPTVATTCVPPVSKTTYIYNPALSTCTPVAPSSFSANSANSSSSAIGASGSTNLSSSASTSS